MNGRWQHRIRHPAGVAESNCRILPSFEKRSGLILFTSPSNKTPTCSSQPFLLILLSATHIQRYEVCSRIRTLLLNDGGCYLLLNDAVESALDGGHLLVLLEVRVSEHKQCAILHARQTVLAVWRQAQRTDGI